MKQCVWAACLALAWVITPSTALATEVLLAPLAGRTVKSTTLTNITSLIYSELDFNSEVSGVSELKSRPSTLGRTCLKTPSCLQGIARLGSGETRLIAGYVTLSGGAYVLQMVLFDSQDGTIVRSKTFTLGASPEALADGMTNIVREVLTGQSKKQVNAEETFDFDFGEEDDDFSFDEPDPAEANNDAVRRAEAARQAEATRRVEAARKAEAARRAEKVRQAEAARRAEATRRAEAARRAELVRQAEATRRAEATRQAEAARRADAAREETDDDDFDPNAFSFGTAAIVIEGEDTPSDLILEEEEFQLTNLDDDDDEVADLDEEVVPKRERVEKPTRTRTERPVQVRSRSTADKVGVELTARAGYSPYFNLGFLTYGAEGAVELGDSGVSALFGLEAYSVKREIPVKFQTDSGQTTEWNTIFPINAGIRYRILDGPVQPYVGADLIVAQYYVNEEGGSWAVGTRARTGLNVMVSDNFGLNANVAMGFWTGKNWGIIQQEVKKSGMLPQISAGTVFAF